jgi:hypothetical protein
VKPTGKSEALAERMRQINAEKQKQKQQEALRKAQEQRKRISAV